MSKIRTSILRAKSNLSVLRLSLLLRAQLAFLPSISEVDCSVVHILLASLSKKYPAPYILLLHACVLKEYRGTLLRTFTKIIFRFRMELWTVMLLPLYKKENNDHEIFTNFKFEAHP